VVLKNEQLFLNSLDYYLKTFSEIFVIDQIHWFAILTGQNHPQTGFLSKFPHSSDELSISLHAGSFAAYRTLPSAPNFGTLAVF